MGSCPIQADRRPLRGGMNTDPEDQRDQRNGRRSRRDGRRCFAATGTGLGMEEVGGFRADMVDSGRRIEWDCLTAGGAAESRAHSG